MEKKERKPIRVTEESRNVFVPVGGEFEFEGIVFRCEENERFERCERCDTRKRCDTRTRYLCAKMLCYRDSRKDKKEVHFVKVMEL